MAGTEGFDPFEGLGPFNPVNRLAEYNLAVVAGTTKYPQSAPGVSMPAGEAMHLLLTGEYTAREYSQDDIAHHPTVYQGMQVATTGIHRLFGTPENPNPASNNLPKAVRFADGIIRIGTVASVIAYGQGAPAEELRLLTPEDHEKFAQIAADLEDVAKLERIFNFAEGVAFAPGGPALKAARKFRAGLLHNNTALIVNRRDRPTHAEIKGRLVGGISVYVGELVLAELTANPAALDGIDTAAAEAAITTMFMAMPNPEIPNHYYGEPK